MYEKLHDLLFSPLLALYWIWQNLLDALLSPRPPPPNAHLSRPRIAVIGAGLTGVSAASHTIGHGFDTVIFEAGSRDAIGGIWAKVKRDACHRSSCLPPKTGEQHVRSPDKLHHVPFPAFGEVVKGIPEA